VTCFEGMVQHSFALRMAAGHHPFAGRSTADTVAERFEARTGDGRAFRVVPVPAGGGVNAADGPAAHSLLTRADLTTVRPQPAVALADGADLPPALSWAGAGQGHRGRRERTPRPQMIFAEFDARAGRTSRNDFLVGETNPDEQGRRAGEVARVLLEAVAFRRSQLFGLAIANRFVNVMLPAATLTPEPAAGDGAGPLLLVPLVSLMRDGSDPRALRRMYSLTLYAVPLHLDRGWPARGMSTSEIAALVGTGWSLADAIPREHVTRYSLGGPLLHYARCLLRGGGGALLKTAETEGSLSLRMVAEVVAYAVALRMAEGRGGRVRRDVGERIGCDVVTALGTARVSAALLVDPDLEPADLRRPVWRDGPPGSLQELMSEVAQGTRAPEPWTRVTRRKYRLDRPFVDSDDYAVGILPTSRCLLAAYATRDRRANPVPLLSLAAGVTYMTVGAATAIGTLRSIDRDLEGLEQEDPRKIAEIDAEIATDLHEIYDLDISRETYRNLYRRLRDRFGISEDYKVLQDKMQTLYRATSTFHDDKEQKQLAWLTAAIVALSILILIGTIVVAAKPG
jgi:hypothetical protein